MKRKLLLIIVLVGITMTSTGQSVSMEIGASGDLSGTQYNITSAGAEVVIDVHVRNLTMDTLHLKVSREWIVKIDSWRDFFCWGHEDDPWGGVCYPTDTVNVLQVGATPAVIPENEGGVLYVHILPDDPDYGCGIYRYRVLNGESEIAYLDVNVCKTLGTSELKPSALVSLAPNPGNDLVTIVTNDTQDATVMMFDVLGNIILTKTLHGSDNTNTIDVSSLKNGIYYLSIQVKGMEPTSRKLIVQH